MREEVSSKGCTGQAQSPKDHKPPCSQCDKKFIMKSRPNAHQEISTRQKSMSLNASPINTNLRFWNQVPTHNPSCDVWQLWDDTCQKWSTERPHWWVAWPFQVHWWNPKTWQRNQATPKLHHSQIKPQVSSHSRCPLHSSSLVATSRGDQGTKKPSGNNSYTPLIVVPNLGVDVVAERPSTKDPNGGIGEKERLWIKLPS